MPAADATRWYQQCLRAVRGEIDVPTWPELLARENRLQNYGVKPDPDRSASPRGEGVFVQLARPSRSRGLAHWRFHACYATALDLARTLCPVDQLRFGYDQCFYKPPGCEAIVYPHQDGGYWRAPGVTCWIALSPVALDTAPVMYYPGSHERLLPHLPAPQSWNQVNDLTVDPRVMKDLTGEPVSFALLPGDCVFHSSLTVHGSGPNRGSAARCGLALHFSAPSPTSTPTSTNRRKGGNQS
jgi:ectoine hydroxylase-related dioxygenase (phytanoyl-CoA dioxygenase family)